MLITLPRYLTSAKNRMLILSVKWACLRIFVEGYVIFCFISIIGGLFSYPLFTTLFLDDYRFWRYCNLIPRLYLHLLHSLCRMIRGGTSGFLFSVPLAAPPSTEPDLDRVILNPSWPHGKSCGSCTHCCDVIRCPLVDHKNRGCMAYDSIYWRYFNCGRFPSTNKQLEYYGCPKWLMRSEIKQT
jgi:hypothetical protein